MATARWWRWLLAGTLIFPACPAAGAEAGDSVFRDANPDDYAPPSGLLPAAAGIRASAGLENAVVRGGPGSVAPGADVFLYNGVDGSFARAAARADGGFEARVAGGPGSWLIVRQAGAGRLPASRAGAADQASRFPGVWTRVAAIEGEDRGGVRFHFQAPAPPGGEGFTFLFEGRAIGELSAGRVLVRGTARLVPERPGAPRPGGARLRLRFRLLPLFDAAGAPLAETGFFFSTLLTATGLPIEHQANRCRDPDGEPGIREGAFRLAPQPDGGLRGPVEFSYPLSASLAPGVYALSVRATGLEGGPLGGPAPERLKVSDCLSLGRSLLPPFRVGKPAEPRLIWTLLADAFGGDASRGAVAREDAGRFGLADHVVVQPALPVVPRLSSDGGRPIVYRLEPYLPMQSQGDHFVPNAPKLSFRFPSGSLRVRVRRPSGRVDELGPSPFRAARASVPLFACGDSAAEFGGGRFGNVFQLSTESRAFDYEFPEDGEYEIEATGWVEDVYGNRYAGGGTYRVLAAKPLDLQPATLFMTPLTAGDALHPGVTLLPGVPAEVEFRLRFLPGSDPARAVERVVRGRANRYGVFAPEPGTPPLRASEGGEFTVDVAARYRDPDGGLWAGTARWGQVVEPSSSPVLARGRRGRDLDPVRPKLWFASLAGGQMQFPYASGDVVWQKHGDAAIPALSLQDPEGPVERRIAEWVERGRYFGTTPEEYEPRVRAGSLPLAFATSGGENPGLAPDRIVGRAYWYAGVERPGERVREVVSTEHGVDQIGYWRFGGQTAGLQRGIGPEGDLPNDFKFLYGGAVFLDPAGGLRRYASYGALWVHLPDDDPVGGRVFPPFQGLNGGPSGGPLLTLRGREIDAFLVPTALRPGAVLEVGDSFSFAAALAPALPARVSVSIEGPGGFRRGFEGRANRVGYFYDPAGDFAPRRPGVYRVSARAVFDVPTSAGPAAGPVPIGRPLGTGDDGAFEVYVVEPGAPPLAPTPSSWRAIKGVGPVPLRVDVPGPGVVRYTLAMPGFVLERGSATVSGGAFTLRYDPTTLSRDFPNLDLRGPCGKPGLVDTVWAGLLFEGRDGSARARQFTLHGPELFPH